MGFGGSTGMILVFLTSTTDRDFRRGHNAVIFEKAAR
jgi:hypothetical protein